MTLVDQKVRDRIANDLDTTMVIEAAAGTGKTTELINRVVAVIAMGRTTLDRVVAVTFTEKAAGELKLRLREQIEKGRVDQRASRQYRERLQRALEHLEQARIATIHSFCGDLLRERPVEAGVDPRFEVAPRDVADEMLGRAFDRWFEAALASPGPGLRRILSRRQFGEEGSPRAMLRRAARDLVEWRDFDAVWPHESFEREREIDQLIVELSEVGELASQGPERSYLTDSLSAIRSFVHEATRMEKVRGRDYDSLEARLMTLPNLRHWRWKGSGEMFGKSPRAQVLERRDNVRSHLREFGKRAQAELAPLIRQELLGVVGLYQELKQRAGMLDFMDLLLMARDVIRGNAMVRAELQHRFTHIFIDEFQDTEPVQAEILLLLSADDPNETDYTRVQPKPGKLFIVGDPKQSIYRFRRADVALYQRIKLQLVERGAFLGHLTVSFRSVPELQQMVNAAFAPLMKESESQAGYEPLNTFRERRAEQPAVIALPVPVPYADYGKVTERSIEQSLPEAVGAMVDWLINHSGWKVTENTREEKLVDIEARHVCLLFRRFVDFDKGAVRPYVRALEARHIAHVLVKGTSFHEREEVEALRNALSAIERPEDELAVFATLRGPLFALSDAALLAYREAAHGLHPFRKTPENMAPQLAEVAAALETLRTLHRGRNRRPIADSISRLLAATRAHAGFAMWPTGEQALANVSRLLDEARRYESRREGTSFRGFVEYLDDEARAGEAQDAPVVEEGTEGVRIMTVHSAKGLEFPVVILADLTCKETRQEAQRLVDGSRRLCLMRLAGCQPRELIERNEEENRREREEADRLLYVATTRARDLLIVPAIGDEFPGEESGSDDDDKPARWLDKLTPALFPPNERRRAPLAAVIPGLPAFGDDSVRVRPDPPRAYKGPWGKARSVAPGIHRPVPGQHRAVWWDPNVLKLDANETMGLRQMKLLQADESGKVSEAGKAAYQKWSAERSAVAENGKRPQMRVMTATELAADAKQRPVLPEVKTIAIEQVARVSQRPHGPRFGTLVHEVMLSVGFDAEREAIGRAASFHARLIGANDAETAATVEAVAAALGSKTIARARAAKGRCRRECAVLTAMDDGTLVEGIADLAFEENAQGGPRWTVVDFKTDLDLTERLEEYRAQLAIYIRGISRSTGQLSSGVLLWI